MTTKTPINEALAAQAFSAIGSESRLAVLKLLVRAGSQGLAIGTIQERTGMPASTLAHHLKFLLAGNLITQEKQGRQVLNTANYEHIRALSAYLLAECCMDACEAQKERE